MEYTYCNIEDYSNWLKEGSEWLAKSEKMPNKNFILKNHQCPGDILMLSACIRDIKTWYPHFSIDIETSCDSIFDNSPYITKLDNSDPSVRLLDMQYEIIHQSNQDMNKHFIHGFIQDFNERTGNSVKLTQFKPDLHLSEDEKKPVFNNQPEKFIVLNAGGKTDYTTKWWWKEAWTEVINLCPEINFIQIGKSDKKDTGAGKATHSLIELPNVLNKLNKTSFREVIRLVYQSVGTLSVVTSIMHIAAAFNKRACVIAGGHEPWWWEKYPNHDYFHSIGALDCCRLGGCWKKDCENKSDAGKQKCLELIDPKKVAETLRSWF